ncbi:hypothetical protein GGI07_000163 [Coemansia sp. Benny D115]|nr:hypothetical protein GGI07_000163 [Coemansia sp. Benny D115]
MRTGPLIALIVATVTLGVSLAEPYPLPGQNRQEVFGAPNGVSKAHIPDGLARMPYTFDSDATGTPQLSDVIGQEKSATIAMDAILQSEALMRALSGDSVDFKDGLTLLLPTNEAFRSLGSVPDDLELVMKRHFIPQVVTPQAMVEGVTVRSYERLATLRFSSSNGKAYVQVDRSNPVEIRGSGVQAGSGTYFLVDKLFV